MMGPKKKKEKKKANNTCTRLWSKSKKKRKANDVKKMQRNVGEGENP